MRRARDLLRSIGGPDAKNQQTEEEDLKSHKSACRALQDSNIVELFGMEEAPKKLPDASSFASALNNKIDSEHEGGHSEDAKSNVLMPDIVNNDIYHYTLCASHKFDDSMSSSSNKSTTEIKALCITVVTRSSRYVSFPSSRAHTYATFFRATLLMSQIVAILDEQLCVAIDSFKDQKAGDEKRRKYQGEYNQEGKKHGYGIYTSKNGNEYLGEWQNGRREGLGIVKVGNGDIFEGQFEHNLKCGIGVYHYKGKRSGFIVVLFYMIK